MIVVNAGTFQVLLLLSNTYIHAKAGTEKTPEASYPLMWILDVKRLVGRYIQKQKFVYTKKRTMLLFFGLK